MPENKVKDITTDKGFDFFLLSNMLKLNFLEKKVVIDHMNLAYNGSGSWFGTYDAFRI